MFLILLQKLELLTTNKNYRLRSGILLVLFLTVLIFQSCNPTKYVPEGKYLLADNKIKSDQNKEIQKKEFKSYIRQKPNKKFLGIRFKLGLYNLSNLEKEKGFSKWLRKIGEPPVIFDETQDVKSSQQLASLLEQNGYFQAEIDDTLWYIKQKAFVEYRITMNKPHRFRKVMYQVNDPVLEPIVLADTAGSMLKIDDIYKVETIDKERARLERLIKNNGYYTFQKEFISFIADSTVGEQQIDLTVNVKSLKEVLRNEYQEKVSFSKYKIRKVIFFLDYDPGAALEDPTSYFSDLDTTYQDGLYFVTKKGKSPIHYDVVFKANYIQPGDLYNLNNVEQTKKHLSSLEVIKLTDIYFSEVPEQAVSDTGSRTLDCHIQVAPSKLQAYSVEVEGTNSSGNFGVSANLLYQHRNLFRRAEVLNLKLKGAYEALPAVDQGYSNMTEVGIGGDIVFPRFLVPFLNTEGFVKKYNPKTSLFSAYNFQRRPEYKRTMFSTSFGYNWQANKYMSHLLSPVDISVVKLPYIDSSWLAYIDATSYLAYSYRDAFIAGLSYSFILTDQILGKNMDYYYFRLNLSSAGNLIHLGNKIFSGGLERPDSNTIFGIEYSQYIRADFDFRYHSALNESNSMVYRLFLGVGYPYGNSKVMPFEKQYFTGGANDIRAWPVRALGPGNFETPLTAQFYNQTADIKIVANLEYRFKLFWLLEGALFLDAGNIWIMPGLSGVSDDLDNDNNVKTEFNFNTFLNQMALGTGLGVRLDLSFFLFRIDLGYKLRNPQSEWFPEPDEPGFFNYLIPHFAVGYPF